MDPISDCEIIETIEKLALTAVEMSKTQFDIELDFSEKSLENVEEVLSRFYKTIPKGITKLWSRGPSESQLNSVSIIYGAYIGEVIRRHYGGEWSQEDDSGIFTLVSKEVTMVPSSKVYKRITNGPEDNVSFYYTVFKTKFAGQLK